MSWYQLIDSKLQGNNLIGINIINTIASVHLHWQQINLPINNVDIVGGVIQSWLSSWFTQEGIAHTPNRLTQQWPDFWIPIVIQPNQVISYPLEVKSFKKGAGPAFDISDFNLYINSIDQNPSKLDCTYLIFEYEILPNGFRLTRYWWKNVWEIIGNSSGLVTLQTRQRNGMTLPNNLRPYSFFSTRPNCLPILSRLEFIQILDATCRYYYPEHNPNWINTISSLYQQQTGQPL